MSIGIVYFALKRWEHSVISRESQQARFLPLAELARWSLRKNLEIKMKRYLILSTMVAGCVTIPPSPPPQWNQVHNASEQEYAPYLQPGTASISGQAFLNQRGGGVVKAAGRNVTLDPATSVGNEWWGKAGVNFRYAALTPPSPAFHKARKVTVADAEGRFKFTGLPAGEYYVRTEVTWEVPGLVLQGGLVGTRILVNESKTTEVILNQFAQ